MQDHAARRGARGDRRRHLHRPVLRFLAERDGRWGIVRRQPIYEKDRLDPVDPAAGLSLDPELLGSFPAGYRHLAYLQFQLGYQIAPGLPGLRGPAVDVLYQEGRDWLDGSPRPGVPTADSLARRAPRCSQAQNR